MRILYLVHQFFPEFGTGTERVTRNLAKAAQRANHHVEVLTCSVGAAGLWRDAGPNGWLRSSVDGIPVHAIPGAAIGDPYGFRFGADAAIRDDISRFLDAGRYDLVHVVHSMRMLDAIECVRAHAIPYVMTLTDFFSMCYRINLNRLRGGLCDGPAGAQACHVHCAEGDVTGPALEARYELLHGMLHGAEDLVACSAFVAAAYAREFPALPVRVIEHGIDLLRFRPWRHQAGEKLVFGYLGTLSRHKGVHVLAQGFAQAALPNARLELIGGFGGGDIEAELRQLAKENPAIQLHDPVDATMMPDALATFDVNCLPTLVPETFSLTLHEGFAAGLPALASDIGNVGEVVRRHDCGLLVAPGDIGQWRDAITAIAAEPGLLDTWRARLPLPMRQEEEGFLYDQVYRFARNRMSRALGAPELAA